MNATARRTSPSQYYLNTYPQVGMTVTVQMAIGNQTFEIVGEPIKVGSSMWTAKVVEADGNTFCAYLTN